jgi:phosphatidylserine/phosphatidylglycerophosphate/cardiolipin synthase-like enzyme
VREAGKETGISIQLVAGTYVVLIGMSVDPDKVDRLLGFSIERTDHTEGESYYLSNNFLFKANDVPKPDYSTEDNPVQAFVWGDYTAKPKHTYTYTVTARYGKPGALENGPQVAATVTTEDPDDGTQTHGVYFNRGVAASAAYERRFGNVRPRDVPNEEAYHWLSRGLEEALVAFIGDAADGTYALRGAFYEFYFGSVLDAFKAAHDAGADVQIVYDAVKGETTSRKNPEAAKDAQIKGLCDERTNIKISHNKFVVLLKDKKPIEVWTGSTNISEGGLYGHTNVGHRIRDEQVAQRYLDYWERLVDDPETEEMRQFDDQTPAIPEGRPEQPLTAAFSPRSSLDSLDWYVRLAKGAQQGVFLTAAFGMQKEIEDIFTGKGERKYLRYLLLDSEKEGKVKALRRDPGNIVSAGAFTGKGAYKTWLAKALVGMNPKLHYMHTKLMIVDPLTDDPIVVTGSANWSNESSETNDENMVVIRDDKRVADIYLTDFMRIFNHYRIRGKAETPEEEQAPGPKSPPKSNPAGIHLAEDNSWAKPFYEDDSPEARERRLFSGVSS